MAEHLRTRSDGENRFLREMSMLKKRPHCDRHRSLQMLPCSFIGTGRGQGGYICPVPGCGRCHDGEAYFEQFEILATPRKKLNRQQAARAAILKAVGGRPDVKPNS